MSNIKRTLLLHIESDDKLCGLCHFNVIFSNGLIGEWHRKCTLFPGHFGEWRQDTMKRCKECLAAEKAAFTQRTRS